MAAGDSYLIDGPTRAPIAMTRTFMVKSQPLPFC
jgi:hypothetical protein